MPGMSKSISVKTRARDDMTDITDEVARIVSASGIADGICVVFTPHTTAGITINENADPDVQRDMVAGLNALGFERLSFRHGEGNSPAHLKSSLVGCSETIIISGGRLLLGTWQGIYLCEFDGPRTRTVHIRIQ
jgi:secondary thiamine-phosphate synthase enzyme